AECDLDHDTDYDPAAGEPGEGATHPDNVHVMHRGHHNAKTGRFWRSRQHRDGSISWQTLTRRLRTTPFDHHRPDDQAAPVVSAAEQQVGIRLALCREHDVVPNVFTDLADLRLIHDTSPPPDPQTDPQTRPKPPGRVHLFRHRGEVRIEFPEPPPPF
ncbi:MAG: hypothetical protein ACTHL4_17060, partial [Flexivirga sp.]